MIDVEQVIETELGPEMKEFLRMTMPNLGFFSLCDLMQVKINQELANLNTSCTDADFRQKYDKLLLERDLYAMLHRVAKSFQPQQAEEIQ